MSIKGCFRALVLSLGFLSVTGMTWAHAGRASKTNNRAILLEPARVFTATDNQTHAGWVVLVRGKTVRAVGPASDVDAPANARIIKLKGMTLLPGLIDAHSHIFLHPYNETPWDEQVLKEPVPYRTIEAVKHVKATLMAGFTVLRDLGTEGAGFADVSVQEAINNGLIPGPRLFVATRATVASDCYGPGPYGYRNDLDLPQGGIPVSGRAEMLAAVRKQVGHGADWVKVYADYSCGKSHQAVPTFTE
jgi:imidazolonepropionase-like amidohydrolase